MLRPGGRFCVSDIVATGELPAPVRDAAGLYAGCIAGAIPQTVYMALIGNAGLEGVRVAEAKPIPLPDAVLEARMSPAEIAAFRASGVGLLSVTVLGSKPVPWAASPVDGAGHKAHRRATAGAVGTDVRPRQGLSGRATPRLISERASS